MLFRNCLPANNVAAAITVVSRKNNSKVLASTPLPARTPPTGVETPSTEPGLVGVTTGTGVETPKTNPEVVLPPLLLHIAVTLALPETIAAGRVRVVENVPFAFKPVMPVPKAVVMPFCKIVNVTPLLVVGQTPVIVILPPGRITLGVSVRPTVAGLPTTASELRKLPPPQFAIIVPRPLGNVVGIFTLPVKLPFAPTVTVPLLDRAVVVLALFNVNVTVFPAVEVGQVPVTVTSLLMSGAVVAKCSN